jgi:4-amino-4-deoxy-L-arabinose transferase-like glycosyltransferase
MVYDIARYFAAPPCVMHIIGWGNTLAGFIGFTLLCYSLLLVIASSLAVYRLARIVDPAAA